MADIHFRGIEAMSRKMRAMARRFNDELARAQRQETEFLRTKKVIPRTPKADGGLRDSIHVPPVEHRGKLVITRIVAGGTSAPYARAVHEHPNSETDPPSWQGKVITFSPPGTGPKYIEGPLLEAIPTFAEKVAKRIDLNRLATGGGGTGGPRRDPTTGRFI